jgi:chemotaxis protein MotA
MSMPAILDHLLTPGPLLAVWIGAIMLASLQQGISVFAQAVRALRPLVLARPDIDRDAARALLFRVEAAAELKGLATTDRIKARHPFMADALKTLANARNADHFALWIAQALDDREARHACVVGWWNAVADAAPACGMAGTVIGLVSMFAAMADPASIGPAMALALLTTLHGLLLANAFAAPVAQRLAQLSARELAWQRAAGAQMLAIASRETAMPARNANALRGAA